MQTFFKSLTRIFGSRNEREVRKLWPQVEAIKAREKDVSGLADGALRERAEKIKADVRAAVPLDVPLFGSGNAGNRAKLQRKLDEVLIDVFALVREAAFRTRNMKHFPVQLLGGIVQHQGKISEMGTGEGKTLVATAPAFLNALAGRGVHIVTVNDYLARRDREWMGPIYELLGLKLGVIEAELTNAQRRPAYDADITYGTNNEFGFDYLRDNMKLALDDQVQRRHYAIVDEVDNILIDEARTPLIISGAAQGDVKKYFFADRVARQLKKDAHFEVKEKEHQVLLTEEGIVRAQEIVGVDTFYSGPNMEWPHLLEQALRAHHLYERDDEYVVAQDEDGRPGIVIVDEFTGRLMQGRRWSDGLHQAVEAKEQIPIRAENQTLATITLQNYFRLYNKLAGMTGTAITEAGEFMKIYSLDVIVVPPNRPCVRADREDKIYLTPKDKFTAVLGDLLDVREASLIKSAEGTPLRGTERPILVGTTSIEKSEKISEVLQKKGVPHNVLNAKNHAREAEIIAQAGRLGAVTIATNMAGRGTDILLGGNPEFYAQQFVRASGADLAAYEEAPLTELVGRLVNRDVGSAVPAAAFSFAPELREEVARRAAQHASGLEFDPDSGGRVKDELIKALARVFRHWVTEAEKKRVIDDGGLYILGTERHEARRIDNQLRGRAGRQGDPGASRFFLSMDDELMRRFASPTVRGWLQKLGLEGGEAIEHRMVSRSVEKAQKKVEERNFEIRKRLLEFDEVMNEQRTLVYDYRQQILRGEGLREMVDRMFVKAVEAATDPYVAEKKSDRAPFDEEAKKELRDWYRRKTGLELENVPPSPEAAATALQAAIAARYDAREAEVSAELMRTAERHLLLDAFDVKWKDHLYNMDSLRHGIGLRSYAGEDSKVAYKREGYQLFEEMLRAIEGQVTDYVLRIELRSEQRLEQRDVWSGGRATKEAAPGIGEGSQQMADAANKSQATEKPKPFKREQPKVGRNDPCPCGSGKKYKYCHGVGLEGVH
jgi:preprotein translocase subunit SecA